MFGHESAHAVQVLSSKQYYVANCLARSIGKKSQLSSILVCVVGRSRHCVNIVIVNKHERSVHPTSVSIEAEKSWTNVSIKSSFYQRCFRTLYVYTLDIRV